MKKPVRWALRGLAVVAGLLLLFHLEENWRGRRAWDAWNAERRAAGDSFTIASLRPHPIPDSENFAAHSVVAGAVSGKGSLPEAALEAQASSLGGFAEGRREDLAAWREVLQAKDLDVLLQSKSDLLSRLGDAARRPGCRYPYDPDKGEIPGLIGIRNAARTLRLRALVRLSNNQGEQALEDLITLLRMARHAQRDPSLISALLESTLANFSMQPIWEGIGDHRWSDSQLAKLQQALAELDLLLAFHQAAKVERIYGSQGLSENTKGLGWNLAKPYCGVFFPQEPSLGFAASEIVLPKGLAYLNLVAWQQKMLEGFETPINPKAHRVDPSLNRKCMEWLDAGGHWSPYTFVVRIALPSLLPYVRRAARIQVSIDLALLACALERYRLELKAHPRGLEDLVPRLLARAPTDVMDGQPYRYQRLPDGSFRLWSVGWDQKDDGGQVVLEGDFLIYRLDGQDDWVEERALHNLRARVLRSEERGDWTWLPVPKPSEAP